MAARRSTSSIAITVSSGVTSSGVAVTSGNTIAVLSGGTAINTSLTGYASVFSREFMQNGAVVSGTVLPAMQQAVAEAMQALTAENDRKPALTFLLTQANWLLRQQAEADGQHAERRLSHQFPRR